jgi:hypothetical protein
VRVEGDAKPTIRTAGNRTELVVPFTGNNLKYSIIW